MHDILSPEGSCKRSGIFYFLYRADSHFSYEEIIWSGLMSPRTQGEITAEWYATNYFKEKSFSQSYCHPSCSCGWGERSRVVCCMMYDVAYPHVVSQVGLLRANHQNQGFIQLLYCLVYFVLFF